MAFHKMNKFHWHLTEDQVGLETKVLVQHALQCCLTFFATAVIAWEACTREHNAICSVSAEYVQGWRLEVKGYPKLTQHGAWRGREGSSYGGFYSQEEVHM